MIPDDLIAYVEVQQLHAEVARVLDAGEFARWPEFFTEDGRYVVQSRENHERGWPLALIHLESRAMLKDRVVGATETIFMFISGTPADHRPGSTGKPVSYAQVRLLDEAGEPVTAPDAKGVAYVRIGSLCRGYWRRPDVSEAAIQDGWFRTGDVFSVDAEGWWTHHGRFDDLLKVSGQWVSPAEIEECAVAVPGVAEAAVVGVANADGLVRLALFLVAERSPGPELERAVQQKMLDTLAVYKCPRRIVFVESIPRTATGKVQRYLLRRMAPDADSLTRA